MRYKYPQWVWSPTGGWWPHPRMWKLNTGVVIFGLVTMNFPIFLFGERNLVFTLHFAAVH